MHLFLLLDGLYGFLFLTQQHFIVITELRALLKRYCFLLSLKGNSFPELLLELNLLCLGLLDGHAFGSNFLILAYFNLELIYLLRLLNIISLGLLQQFLI